MRYLRLWSRFVATAFVREAEYRINFLAGAAEGAAQLILAVLTTLLLYRFTDQVAGWTRAELLMLVGVYRIVDSLLALQIAPNLLSIAGYIREGEMDFFLLRPVNSQFHVSLRRLALPEAVNVLAGLGLTIYAGIDARLQWTAAGVAAAAAVGLCGVILLYALWFFSVTFCFWLVNVGTLDILFYSVFETARYPVTFFKGLVRALLIFAFPVAFATTFPTQALLGELDPRMIFMAVILAAAALLGTQLFWRYAVRHYSSASS